MESIKLPTLPEIAKMSVEVCYRERTRLRTEISFARGNAMWDGPSDPSHKIIVACNEAIEMIDTRLTELTQAVEHGKGDPSSNREWPSERVTPI